MRSLAVDVPRGWLRAWRKELGQVVAVTKVRSEKMNRYPPRWKGMAKGIGRGKTQVVAADECLKLLGGRDVIASAKVAIMESSRGRLPVLEARRRRDRFNLTGNGR